MSNQPTPQAAYKAQIESGAIQPDASQNAAVEDLQRLYEALCAPRRKGWKFWQEKAASQGVYMYGGVGRGKSMLMDLFFEALPEGVSKRRVHFHAFMIDVHDYFHSRREADDFGDGVDGALPALASLIAAKSRVLCFDEFHVTDVADAMILGRLFTALFDRGVVVVATSNWSPDNLYEGGLQRERFLPFVALLKQRMKGVNIDGNTDYRLCNQTQGSRYFCPLGDVTDEALDAVFDRLRAGRDVSEETLEVKGREIHAEYVAGDIARFSFAQLCERPHGAEDYLALAQRFTTIFLEQIPKLGYDRRNEAKRLMILIDALYENNVQVFFSADAAPEKLYRGHDHGFEFERTVSRIIEIQSDEYQT